MNQRQNHIDNLTHEQLLELHRQGLISIRASIQRSMRFCQENDVGLPIQLNIIFWRYLSIFISIGAIIGAPISAFFIKWYWSVLIFFGGSFLSHIIMKGIFVTTAETLQRQILYNPDLYYACLSEGVLLIEYN